MKYERAKDEIRRVIEEDENFSTTKLTIDKPSLVMPAHASSLPALSIIMNTGKVEQRAGLATTLKIISFSVIVVEDNEQSDSIYLPFLELVFQKKRTLHLNRQEILRSDLIYTDFKITHKNESERFLSFLVVNLNLELEEIL